MAAAGASVKTILAPCVGIMKPIRVFPEPQGGMW
jgi:hypothetical protein